MIFDLGGVILMAFPFAALFGGPAIASTIGAIGNVLDNCFTSEEEKLDKKILLQRLALQPDLAQAEISKLEAQHRSVFVAGWRPAVGWVCAAALAYNYILRDLMIWLFTAFAPETPPPPALAMEHLMTILLSILGVGSLRSIEKLAGRAK